MSISDLLPPPPHAGPVLRLQPTSATSKTRHRHATARTTDQGSKRDASGSHGVGARPKLPTLVDDAPRYGDTSLSQLGAPTANARFDAARLDSWFSPAHASDRHTAFVSTPTNGLAP